MLELEDDDMPAFPVTPEHRRTVRAMAAYGIPEEKIAAVIQCTAKTLRKHFRYELDTAMVEANAKVAQTLFRQATEENNTAACIFWLKARAGWSERQVQTVEGGDKPVTIVIDTGIRRE